MITTSTPAAAAEFSLTTAGTSPSEFPLPPPRAAAAAIEFPLLLPTTTTSQLSQAEFQRRLNTAAATTALDSSLEASHSIDSGAVL